MKSSISSFYQRFLSKMNWKIREIYSLALLDPNGIEKNINRLIKFSELSLIFPNPATTKCGTAALFIMFKYYNGDLSELIKGKI